MTQAISPAATGFATELAELMLQTESAQSDSARLQRDAARKEFLDDAQNQVKQLHDAASDITAGAFASAAFTLAGSACTIDSAFSQYEADKGSAALCALGPKTTLQIASDTKAANIWGALGKGFDALGAPAKSLIGDAPAADANADAKRSETLSEKAKWLAGDASTELDKADKLEDKVLDLLQGVNQDQNAANNALIGRI